MPSVGSVPVAVVNVVDMVAVRHRRVTAVLAVRVVVLVVGVGVVGGHLVVERDGLPTGACTALPVVLAGRVVGHFSVVAATRTIRPDPEQLRVAMLLADRMSPRPEASRPRP